MPRLENQDRLQKLLNWKIPTLEMSRRTRYDTEILNKSPSKQRKRHKKNDGSFSAVTSSVTPTPSTSSLATGPAPSSTPALSTTAATASAAQEKSNAGTREPGLFDMHLPDDLILRRTRVVPGIAAILSMACDHAVEAKPHLKDLPRDHQYSLTQVFTHKKSNKIQEEGNVHDVYEFREGASAHVASTLMSSSNSWRNSGDGATPLKWRKIPTAEQKKGKGDGYLHIDGEYIASERAAKDPLTDGLRIVIQRGRTPIAVWEFKDLDAADEQTMVAIRELCTSGDPFEWTSCNAHSGSRCKRRSCKKKSDGSFAVSGEPTGFDSSFMESLISEAMLRKDPLNPRWNHIRPESKHYRKAKFILQQIWAELVGIDGTCVIINGGNLEIIALRHRATQTLFCSDVLEVTRESMATSLPDLVVPRHMSTHIGFDIVATYDAIMLSKTLDVLQERHPDLTPTRLTRTYDLTVNKTGGVTNAEPRAEEPNHNFGRLWTPSVLQDTLLHARTVRLIWKNTICGLTHIPEKSIVLTNEVNLEESQSDDFSVVIEAPIPELGSEYFVCHPAFSGAAIGPSDPYRHDEFPFFAKLSTDPSMGARFRREHSLFERLHHSAAVLPFPLGYFQNAEHEAYVSFVACWGKPLCTFAPKTVGIRLWNKIGQHLSALHQDGYAHGDLRDTDILINDRGGKLEPLVQFINWHRRGTLDDGEDAEERKIRDQSRLTGLEVSFKRPSRARVVEVVV